MSTERLAGLSIDSDVVTDWLADDPDPDDRAELAALSPQELAERFAHGLRFGTAGLRGPVRAGPNGMNVAVVTRVTAGLAAWLQQQGHAGGTVVLGRDTRHGSERFFVAAGEVLAAAGFDVVALPDPQPTPVVAFACRDLGAVAGVQITASHNPPADNGYKVYVAGGGQLIPPADAEIEALIKAAPAANAIAREPVSADARARDAVERYIERVAMRFPNTTASDTAIRIALTPMHGVGGSLAVAALARAGFTDVHVVDEQFTPDPDFPTVSFPNPEEPGAADLLLALAHRVSADVAIALDPDADRCAVGARIDGVWRMLTGDETGGLLGEFVLAELPPTSTPPPVVASTIVSGSLLRAVAAAHGARHVTTLTGFKWLVRAGEPLAYAYEEAIGHCVDPDAVRDKDGITAAVAMAIITQRRVAAGADLAAALAELFKTHGIHVTALRSIRVSELSAITDVMHRLRTQPPTDILGIAVTISDYALRDDDLHTDAVELRGIAAGVPGVADGVTLRVMARPSGTEPKLKYYIEMISPPPSSTAGQNDGTAATDIAQITSHVQAVAAELPG